MIVDKDMIKALLDKYNLVAKETCFYCKGTGYSKITEMVCHCVQKRQSEDAHVVSLPSRKNVQLIMEELRDYHRNQK